jgi:hypothetical protein
MKSSLNFSIMAFLAIILLSGFASASFKIKYSCPTIQCVEGEKIIWNVTITNEDKDVIRVSLIELKELSGFVTASHSGRWEIEFQGKEQIIFEGIVPSPDNYTYAYYYPCFTFYTADEIKGTVITDLRCYDVANITVMPSPIIRCDSDVNCSSASKCEGNLCFKVKCSECEYAKEHACVKYPCCKNDECAGTEECNSHECTMLSCPEDYAAEEHICKKLSCGFLESAKNNRCERDFWLYSGLVVTFVVFLLFMLVLFLNSVKIGKKSIIQMINDKRKIDSHKKAEAKLLSQAETRKGLLKYDKSPEAVEGHKKEIKKYEAEARKEHLAWEKIMGVQTCPECRSLIQAGLRICPKCGEKLKKGAL